jgi:hypothetical protein
MRKADPAPHHPDIKQYESAVVCCHRHRRDAVRGFEEGDDDPRHVTRAGRGSLAGPPRPLLVGALCRGLPEDARVIGGQAFTNDNSPPTNIRTIGCACHNPGPPPVL